MQETNSIQHTYGVLQGTYNNYFPLYSLKLWLNIPPECHSGRMNPIVLRASTQNGFIAEHSTYNITKVLIFTKTSSDGDLAILFVDLEVSWSLSITNNLKLNLIERQLKDIIRRSEIQPQPSFYFLFVPIRFSGLFVSVFSFCCSANYSPKRKVFQSTHYFYPKCQCLTSIRDTRKVLWGLQGNYNLRYTKIIQFSCWQLVHWCVVRTLVSRSRAVTCRTSSLSALVKSIFLAYWGGVNSGAKLLRMTLTVTWAVELSEGSPRSLAMTVSWWTTTETSCNDN